MASSVLKIFLLVSSISFSSTWAINSSSTSSTQLNLSSITSFCKSAPYPEVCFDSLKLSISINISPSILTYLLQTLQNAISEAQKLTDLFSTAAHSNNIIEKQRGSIQDCKELHQITLSSLQKSSSKLNAKKIPDARALLSAALTNKNTCLEGLDSATGTMKTTLVNSVVSTYKYVSNSLSAMPKQRKSPTGQSNLSKPHGRRLLGFPAWMTKKDRRILQTSGDDEDDGITVAADGTGDFTTVTDAINSAPNNSYDRVFIYVKQGVYQENVEIPSYKTNIVLLGDGASITVITGSRSVVDGWTTFRSATVAVSGDGFLARDITFQNTAGPSKHQAVALRVNADLAALFRCTIKGYQDTLYVHSFRQFYRECDIYGTIDFIFGNAAVVFQASNIISRMPLPGQFTVITAQSRDTPDEDTGISIQNCSISAADDFLSNSNTVKSYLGRPWRIYSTTVFMESYIGDFIDPSGWTEWSGDLGLDTLYYGEYENNGPGSGTDSRVDWEGYHVMDYYDASYFTVAELLTGDEWLESTNFPYDDGI